LQISVTPQKARRPAAALVYLLTINDGQPVNVRGSLEFMFNLDK
jgi:hypothetical protein